MVVLFILCKVHTQHKDKHQVPGAMDKEQGKVFNLLILNWALLSVVLEGIRRMCQSVSDKKACGRHVMLSHASLTETFSILQNHTIFTNTNHSHRQFSGEIRKKH